MSSSGQYQSASIDSVDSSGGIYISNNYGNTWIKNPTSSTAQPWKSVTISASGQYQTAVVYAGSIWISNNYGNLWIEKSSYMYEWWSVSISASGQYQTAVEINSDGIWRSTDYGNTWTLSAGTTSQNWVSVAVSASGQYQTALQQNGSIWTSNVLTILGNMQINGNVQINGTVSGTTFTSTSDYRVKENIRPLDDSFSVDNIKPVTYFNKLINKQDIGVIAHEIQEIYPFLVTGEKDGLNYQNINYTGLIGILIKEMQNLKEKVDKQEIEIKELKQKN
jgi:hypothetical protein